MRLIGKKSLKDFKEEYHDAKAEIDAWEAEIENTEWKTPHELKNRYPKASLLGNRHVIFNICGTKYRLWARVSYKNGIVVIEKIGTHKEYDRWDIK